MQVAAAMFTPASLMAVATRANAPGAFSISMARSDGMDPTLSDRWEQGDATRPAPGLQLCARFRERLRRGGRGPLVYERARTRVVNVRMSGSRRHQLESVQDWRRGVAPRVLAAVERNRDVDLQRRRVTHERAVAGSRAEVADHHDAARQRVALHPEAVAERDTGVVRGMHEREHRVERRRVLEELSG